MRFNFSSPKGEGVILLYNNGEAKESILARLRIHGCAVLVWDKTAILMESHLEMVQKHH